MAEDDPRPGDDENSDDDESPGDAENDDGSANGNGKPAKSRKLPLIIGAGVLLILAAVGGGWWTGLLPDLLGLPVERKEARIQLGEPVTVDLPEIKADLKTGACRAPLLRALISVQLFPKDVARLEAAKMQIRDQLIAHLRDVERQELVGKEGTERLRFDVVRIVNQEIQPATAHTVFFRDLLLQ